jgi:hypothetical protein
VIEALAGQGHSAKACCRTSTSRVSGKNSGQNGLAPSADVLVCRSTASSATRTYADIRIGPLMPSGELCRADVAIRAGWGDRLGMLGIIRALRGTRVSGLVAGTGPGCCWVAWFVRALVP